MNNLKLPGRLVAVAIALFSASFNTDAYDLFGNDIMEIDVQNADQCAAACNGNANCQAWTFVRAGLKGPGARCYLKNPVPTPGFNSVCQTNFDCVSGYKQPAWCGDKTQGEVLSCAAGKNCNPKTSKSCSGWWIFRSCTTLQTTDYFCQ